MSVAHRQRTVKIGLFLTNRMYTFCAFFFFQTNTRAIGAEKQRFCNLLVISGLHFLCIFHLLQELCSMRRGRPSCLPI